MNQQPLADILDKALGLGLSSDWQRSPITRGLAAAGDGEAQVDRANRTIHGFAVVTKGEARGHNIMLNDDFLDDVIEQGNESKRGIKMRFDHPNGSSTSIGTALGRAKNFRRDGDVVRADAHLLKSASKSPQGDLASYVLDLAEEDPASFGASIVFTSDEPVEANEQDGVETQEKTVTEHLRVAVLKKLIAADVVDDPAANPDGFLSTSESLAGKLTAFLDSYFSDRDDKLVSKIKQLLSKEGPTMEQDKQATPEATEPKAEAVIEEVKAEEIKAEEVKTEEIKAEEPKAEEVAEPVMASEPQGPSLDELMACCVAVSDEAYMTEQKEIVTNLHKVGTSVEEVKAALKSKYMSFLTNEAPKTTGGASGVEEKTEEQSNLSTEERCAKEFEASEELRAEFGKLSTYVAFAKRQESGHVKIMDTKKIVR